MDRGLFLKGLTAMKRIICALLLLASLSVLAEPIDRQALVTRHNVHNDKFQEFSPLSVGNGRFAFTADVTGLQTFPQAYAGGIPLTTMAEWGWHSFPNTEGYKLEDTFVMMDTQGRPVPYNGNQKGPAADYLRANPHQITLGLIGLVLTRADGTAAKQDDITKIDQKLVLWEGVLVSSFEFEGKPVTVRTCVHPQMDLVAVQIVSPLIAQGRIGVSLRFPYAAGTWGSDPADWSSPDKHQTKLHKSPPFQSVFERLMDDKRYYCRTAYSEGGSLDKISTHEYHFVPARSGETFEFAALFQESSEFGESVSFEKTQSLAVDYWKTFWSTGGAIDLSESSDPRWEELERRIVLSQYLTAIQSQQKYPPQETGLTCNSWFGKFHLEMHWWHGVHFALWDRLPMLERSLGWYSEILPAARAIAERQGYQGVRWPKMTEPGGQDSPSGIGPFLIWQQPHPIYFAELVYRQKPTPETLEQYKEIVFETAAFMASYIHWDDSSEAFVLGPPLIPAQENYKPDQAWNPTYELCYWYWGLETAQKWRQRLGMEIEGRWQNILNNFSLLPERDGIYTAIKPEPYTNTTDHPSMLAALGVLPATPPVDSGTMKKTAQWVFDNWHWADTWGWDYPMLSMTAARVGLPEMAIDAFFIESKKNLYWPNGHNYQRENLPLYLPGNGGLLTAAAMMAAGWDGAPDRHAPGFPETGWVVKWEGLKKMP
jgi:protein-glucosylgalactosylhydroxylysine glucosidase